MQNGKIYKIISRTHPEIAYYGSTVQLLCQRMASHRRECKQPKSYCNSREVLQYDDAQIVLVEKFSCNSKEELFAKEAEYIKNNPCVNKNIPGRTSKQYHQDNKQKIRHLQKQYNEENNEAIKKYKQEYRMKNKSIIRQKKKEFYENNKEALKIKHQEYRDKNKEIIIKRRSEKTNCECGAEVTKSNLSAHRKTKIHLKGLDKIK